MLLISHENHQTNTGWNKNFGTKLYLQKVFKLTFPAVSRLPSPSMRATRGYFTSMGFKTREKWASLLEAGYCWRSLDTKENITSKPLALFKIPFRVALPFSSYNWISWKIRQGGQTTPQKLVPKIVQHPLAYWGWFSWLINSMHASVRL